MNFICKTEIIDDTHYTCKHYFNTLDCYEIVKLASEEYWKNKSKLDSKENYEFGENATFRSLGTMLKNDKFHHGYTILEINEKPWAFGGIRKYNNEIALICSRHFSFYTLKPITHGFLLPFHLDICKNLGYKKAWITINNYNLYWFNTWHVNAYNKKRFRKKLNKLYTASDFYISTCKNLGKMILNDTEQTILEWTL